MTTVYLIRHSIPLRNLFENYLASESTQLRNEKNILSVEGEQKAKWLSELRELENINVLYSSHYVRAMSTAKYIAEKNNIALNVDERLGERKFGVKKMANLPKTFFEDQFKNWDYKLPKGECLNEVSNRMNSCFNELLKKYKNKKIVIVSHGTAISALLKNFCDIEFNDITKLVEIYFNKKIIFDGNWKCPEVFKLEFKNNKLVSIVNIRE